MFPLTNLARKGLRYFRGENIEVCSWGFYLIDQSHVTTAIWWPLGVDVVSVTCMRVRWVSHTWKYTQWNVFLFESSHKSPYWTNPYHMGFRYEASLNFHTYFGQCPNDTFILVHIHLHVCPNYPHTGPTTATAPGGHQMAVVTWDRFIGPWETGMKF